MPAAKEPVTIGLIQAAASGVPAENLEPTLAKAEQAAKDGAQIICTRELFASQYFCQSEDHKNFAMAEPIPCPTTETFQRLAKRCGVVLIVSLFEKRGAGVYHNSAAVIDADGSLLGVYRKMHIPDDPLYYEKFYFTPGDLGFRAWQTRFGKIGVLICWDQWYPEAARLTAMQGAEILFTPPPSAGIPRKRPGTANVSIIHGRRFSAVMRSQTAATLPRSIVSATKPRPAGTAFSFGGKVLSPTRREKSSPMPPKKKRSCSARSTWPKWV